MLNRVILIGRLTRDPELKYIPAGDAVAALTLAVDRPYANKHGEREADFIKVVAWKKTAEACANYLGKGSLVAIDGRLQIRSYDQDGQRRYIAEVVAETVKFLDRRKIPDQGQDRYEGYQGTAVDDEDIPF